MCKLFSFSENPQKEFKNFVPKSIPWVAILQNFSNYFFPSFSKCFCRALKNKYIVTNSCLIFFSQKTALLKQNMKDNRPCLKFSFEKSNLYVKNFVLKICLMSCSGQALHKKWSFPLRKSSVNVVHRKLRVWSYLLEKSLLENFIFCAVWYHSISRMKEFLIKKLQHI